MRAWEVQDIWFELRSCVAGRFNQPLLFRP
jgi:hypothetical protein